MKVRTRLKALRGKRSIKEMEQISGVSRGQLSEIENGRRFPSDKQLDQLERAYGPVEERYEPRVLFVIQMEDDSE